MIKLTHAGATHVGMKRSHNEDCILVDEPTALYLVADGMGGYAAGEVASKLAVETIAEFYRKTEQDNDVTWPYRQDLPTDEQQSRMLVSIKLANLVICETSAQNKKCQGMGSTIVTSHFRGNHLICGWVGDSRLYRVRNKELEQLTEDHSLLNEFKKKGELSERDAANFPYKNILLRGLGKELNVAVDVMRVDVEVGDLFLLCSDGLTGELTDRDILEIVTSTHPDLEKTCDQLITRSCDNGGKDNITALLIRAESQ